MKAVTLAAATLAALSTPVLAGGPTIVEPDPTPAAAAPIEGHDWSGAYVGLGYGRASGTLDYNRLGLSYDLNDGTTKSIYAGYLMQRGNFVFGGELAYSRGNDIYAEGFPLENVGTIIDLKGKVGFARDRAMFYGVLGLSKAKYEFATSSALNFDTTGLGYGLGVDVAVTQRVVVGVEYMARKTDGDFAGTDDTDLDVNTFSLRVGLSF